MRSERQSRTSAISERMFGRMALLVALVIAAVAYWPGLSGSFLFDDYPNIVENQAVQPKDASMPALVKAALSSPSSDLKRPLSSLSFAANYLTSGLDPYAMKATNLAIHLANGVLLFFLTQLMLGIVFRRDAAKVETLDRKHAIAAALVVGCWMVLPINVTGVLYVVQRMETLANLFIVTGLILYIKGRQRMLSEADFGPRYSIVSNGFAICAGTLIGCTAVGVLAKETAVMLPFYAALIEWTVFSQAGKQDQIPKRDWRISGLFLLVLFLPLTAGLVWTLPQVLDPSHWATRNFSLKTRLLSESRVVVDYLVWTVVPTPKALSFYHDDFQISQALWSPWTTAASSIALLGLLALCWKLRHKAPLVALGIAFFLGCQLPTATIIPLELVFEHRNYFASYGVMLGTIPFLLGLSTRLTSTDTRTSGANAGDDATGQPVGSLLRARRTILVCLMLFWTATTWLTSQAWGDPLRLAQELAARAPKSPRAQYELGRTYIIYSHYNPASPFTQRAYDPLEKAAALPNSSILPEQALIFMNSRMGLPQKAAWWDSLIGKLRQHKPTVQDESSLGALTQCAREGHCTLPVEKMTDAYLAALAHPNPSARLLAMYGDYVWNILGDRSLGITLLQEATRTEPKEPAYWVTLIKMLISDGKKQEATQALQRLSSLNIGGRLTTTINELSEKLGTAQ